MKRVNGFTLVELLIGLSLMAILMALAAPSFSGMLVNWKVRGMAENVSAALQLARAEAIKRNGDVRFALVESVPVLITGSTGPTYSADNSGDHWAVFAESAGTYSLIDSRVTPDSATAFTSSTTGATNSGEVVFDSMGRARELTANASFDVSAPGSTCATATDKSGNTVRCLRVVVTPAGSVRMCDPAVSDATDTRKCP